MLHSEGSCELIRCNVGKLGRAQPWSGSLILCLTHDKIDLFQKMMCNTNTLCFPS